MNQEELRKEAAEATWQRHENETSLCYRNSELDRIAIERFIAGAEWEAEREKPIPFQCCPICNGLGKLLAPNCTSSVYHTCDVCNGAKIIPMYTPPKTSKQ